MKHTLSLLLTISLGVQLLHAEAFPTFGIDSVSSEFFREWYQNGDLRHYLDNYSDYVIYETETTGEWGLPEQMVFSINGNSYRWNRLYLNGFRIDSRFQSGSTWYQLNMKEQSLYLNQHRGTIDFVTDSLRASKVWLSNNMGGLRGINPTTQWFINLFHQTASQRNQEGNDLSSRDYIKGAGQAEVTYGIPFRGRKLYQHAYVNFGQRMLNTFDQTGITGQYEAPYYKVQLDGTLYNSSPKVGEVPDRAEGYDNCPLSIFNCQFVENPDIAATLGARKRANQTLVGFALETNDEEQNALKKLEAKHMDMIVLNSLRKEGAAFGCDTNIVTIFRANGEKTELPKMPKTDVAKHILDLL